MSGQTNWIDRMLCYLNAGEPWIVSVRDCAQYHNAVMALRADLAAAIKQRDEATAWRPIETAPMDGTVVMLYGDGRVTCGSWIAEQDITVSDHVGCYPSGETTPAYWQSHDGGFTEEHPPTNWMPLPQPPREKKGGGA